MTTTHVTNIRRIAGAIAGIVVLDALLVGAPFLAFIGIPFAIAAWRYRDAHRVTDVALAAWSLLYVLVGVANAAANGIHESAEDGTGIMNPGDLLFVYVGTPLAAVLVVLTVKALVRRPAPAATATA